MRVTYTKKLEFRIFWALHSWKTLMKVFSVLWVILSSNHERRRQTQDSISPKLDTSRKRSSWQIYHVTEVLCEKMAICWKVNIQLQWFKVSAVTAKCNFITISYSVFTNSGVLSTYLRSSFSLASKCCMHSFSSWYKLFALSSFCS